MPKALRQHKVRLGWPIWGKARAKTERGPPDSNQMRNLPVLLFAAGLLVAGLWPAQAQAAPVPGWTRTPVVGLQVGHWQAQLLPAELAELRGNTGADRDGYKELDANYAVTQAAASALRAAGAHVDVLPAAVPPGYRADAFLAIHADQNSTDEPWRGYKVAASTLSRDRADSQVMADDVADAYASATGLPLDNHTDSVTPDMRQYYAFNWRSFLHAVGAQTPAAIIELGFITDPSDRELLFDHAEVAGSGVANGVLRYLQAVPGLASVSHSTRISDPAPYGQLWNSSCELAAATVALRMRGVNVTEADLITRLPFDERLPEMRGGSIVRWGDPNQGFVGSLDGDLPWNPGVGAPGYSYGVYAGPLAKAVAAFDPDAYGGANVTPDQLKVALAAGRPAIVWLPDQERYRTLPDALRTGTWTSWDGQPVSFAFREHVQVLVGYGPDGFRVANVGYQLTDVPFINTWSDTDFERAYGVLGDMAVVL